MLATARPSCYHFETLLVCDRQRDTHPHAPDIVVHNITQVTINDTLHILQLFQAQKMLS